MTLSRNLTLWILPQPVTSEKQAIADQKDIISVIDLVSKTQEKPTTIVTEAITETIDGHEDVSSTVENIIQESDHVVVEVIIDGKKTETIVNTSDVETETIPKSGTISSAIISSVIAEAIQERDVPVYETDKLVLQVAAGDKKVDSIIPSKIQDTTDSEIKIEVVVKGYDVTSNEKFMTDDKKYNAPKEISVDIVADAVAEAIVIDQEKVSAIKEISKTSDLITVDVISESKKTGAVLDKSTIEEVISEIDSTEKKKPAHSTVDTFKNTSEVICTVDEKKFVEEGTKDKVDVATVKKTTEEEIVDSTEGSTVTEEEVVSIAVGSDKPKKTIPASDDSKSVTADIDVSKKVVNAQILEDEKVIVVEKSEIEEVTKGDRVEEIVGAGEKIVEDTAGKTTVTISREIAPVEHVEVIKGVENAAEVTYSWLSGFVEKINSMLEVGDCKEDVDAAIVAEESKLQVILEKSKTGSTAGVQELDVYYDKLHDTFKSQISDIKTSVNEAYVENKTPQKIVFHDVKEELKKNIDVQVEKAKQVIHEKVVPRTITQKLEADSGSDVVVTEAAKISEIVRYQNVEQAQKGTKAAVAAVVQDTQEKLESWYDVLFGKIRGVIASTETEAGDKKREIQRLITDANEEASAIITEGKKAFEFDYTVSDDCESNVTVTVQDAQKQAIDSFDNIQKIVSTQISAVEEIVVSDDDLEIIEERVSIIETQSKRKAATALENTTEAAISVGFEGKSVTWVETTEFPASFKDVKVFAFDLPDTVVNYRLTISQAWNNVVSKKKPSKFAHIDVEKLVVRWYNVFLEQRCKINYSTCDREVLLISLKLVLTEHSLENAFTDEELDTLCTTWFKLQPFGDSSSLQKINQLDNMYSVSISCGFKLCTLMKVARNAGLNWHAQFTGDVFAACIVRDDITDIKSTSNTVLSNAAMLCCLQSPGELAVVSSNPEILQVAKQNGSKTVLIDRYENNPATQDYDIHFDGLDIFAESYETFHETKTITKTEVPVTRSWFQRVVSTVSDAAESVTHAVIG
ncbi:hypothetical protein G6F56_006367 [Rhizopus delemar]|nr:hypothetical protein G6F56_006367 [Rhizopus delemar]